MSKSLRSVLCVSLLSALAMGATATNAQELSVGISSEPSSIDPHYHNLGPNNSLVRQVYEPLVSQAPANN